MEEYIILGLLFLNLIKNPEHRKKKNLFFKNIKKGILIISQTLWYRYFGFVNGK